MEKWKNKSSIAFAAFDYNLFSYMLHIPLQVIFLVKSKDEIIESLIMSMETRGEKKGQGCVLLKLFMYSHSYVEH